MNRVTFDVEFNTPAFLAGADRASSEWRAESIRGQLHWWFRAVAGARLGLDAMRSEELRLFGSTRTRSLITVLAHGAPGIEPVQTPKVTCRWGKPLNENETAKMWGNPAAASRLQLGFPANPIHYLGYGPIERGRFARGFIRHGENASFTIQWLGPPLPHLFWDAVYAWLAFGGIGARSRHGFGSLHLAGTSRAVEDYQFDISDQGIRTWLTRIKTSAASTLAEWSHFSRASRTYVSITPSGSWEQALETGGAWLMAFRRRYGYPVDERVAKRNRDYDWAAPRGSKKLQGFPDRSGFGLPLPFGEGGETVIWGSGKENRRASPLLLRVSRFNGKYHSVWTHLPSRFLPAGRELAFKNAAPAPGVSTAPTTEMQGIVAEFLDDLSKKTLIRVLP